MSVIPKDSFVGRMVQRMARRAWFRKVGPKVAGPMDRVVRRLTGGRFVVSSLMVPTMVLTTTGARSGERREVPLACLPEGDVFYVVGSNFGRERHPGWTYNLDAHPEADVWYAGRTVTMRATRLDDEATAEVWPRLTHLWPSYDFYAEHSGRHLRVYRLEPFV